METNNIQHLEKKMDIIIHHFGNLELSHRQLSEALQRIDTGAILKLKNELSTFPEKAKIFQTIQEENHNKTEVRQLVIQDCVERLLSDLPNDGKFVSEVNFGEETSKKFQILIITWFICLIITFAIIFFGRRYYSEGPYQKAYEQVYDIYGDNVERAMDAVWKNVNGTDYKR